LGWAERPTHHELLRLGAPIPSTSGLVRWCRVLRSTFWPHYCNPNRIPDNSTGIPPPPLISVRSPSSGDDVHPLVVFRGRLLGPPELSYFLIILGIRSPGTNSALLDPGDTSLPCYEEYTRYHCCSLAVELYPATGTLSRPSSLFTLPVSFQTSGNSLGVTPLKHYAGNSMPVP
jgi:hypothetical protein